MFRAEIAALDSEISRLERAMHASKQPATKEDVMMAKMKTEELKREKELTILEEKRKAEMESIDNAFNENEDGDDN